MGMELFQEDLFTSLQSNNMEQRLDNYIHTSLEYSWNNIIKYHFIPTEDIV